MSSISYHLTLQETSAAHHSTPCWGSQWEPSREYVAIKPWNHKPNIPTGSISTSDESSEYKEDDIEDIEEEDGNEDEIEDIEEEDGDEEEGRGDEESKEAQEGKEAQEDTEDKEDKGDKGDKEDKEDKEDMEQVNQMDINTEGSGEKDIGSEVS
jgi:vacuolar-type H+-ATPase subunit I/STV1